MRKPFPVAYVKNPKALHIVIYIIFFVAGFILPSIENFGRVFGFIIWVSIMGKLGMMSLQRRQSTFLFNLLLGLLVSGEIFFRDFVLRQSIGYLVVEYSIIALSLVNLPSLFKRFPVKGSGWIIKIWAIFCIWATISLLYSPDPLNGRWSALLYLSGLIVIVMVVRYATDEKARAGLINGLILGAVLTAGTALNFHLNASEEFLAASQLRFAQSLTSAVQIGVILCMGALMSLFLILEHKKILLRYIVLFGAFFCVSIITFSRGPLIGLCLAFMILVLGRETFSRNIKTILVLLILCIISGVILMSYFPEQFQDRYIEIKTDLLRLAIWNVSYQLWLQSPWLGWGVGSWDRIYPTYSFLDSNAPFYISDAHNIFFQIATETGGGGALLFSFFIVGLCWKAVQNRSSLALALLCYALVIGMVENWKLVALYALIGLSMTEIVRSQKALQMQRGRRVLFIRKAWPSRPD